MRKQKKSRVVKRRRFCWNSISVELAEKEVQEKRLPVSQEEVGIDVGLKTFAYLSTGEAIANPRKTFIEQEVSKLIRRFGFLAVEALAVRNMVKNPKLAKSIADARARQGSSSTCKPKRRKLGGKLCE